MNPSSTHLIFPGWYYILPLSPNPNYPLWFDLHYGLFENDDSLPVTQWPVELKDGLQHQKKISTMFQHAETRASTFCLLNLLPCIYGTGHYLWDPCI